MQLLCTCMSNKMPQIYIKFASCGHCFAVCPCGAITFNNTTAQECQLDLQHLSNLNTIVRYRRSCRNFKTKSLDIQLLNQLIFQVKSSNIQFQNIKINLIQRSSLNQLGKLVAQSLLELNSQYFKQQEKYDIVFRGCPQVLAFYIDSSNNQIYYKQLFYQTIQFITQLELLLQSQNIGTLWCGMVYAASLFQNELINQFLHINNGQKLVCCLGIGLPEMQYLREIPQQNYQFYDFVKIQQYDDELYQYAEYIGIDPKTEQYLMHLAREGLEAPLPPDWVAIQDSNHEYSFKNVKTGVIQQDHPLDDYYRQQVIKERQQHEEEVKEQQQSKKQGLSLLDQINAIQNKQTQKQQVQQQQQKPQQQQQQQIQYQQQEYERDSPEINLDNLDNSTPENKVYTAKQQQNDEVKDEIQKQNEKIEEIQQQYQDQINSLKQTQQIQLQELQQTQKQLIQDMANQFQNQMNKVSQQLENQINETQRLKLNQTQNIPQKDDNDKQKQMEVTINNLQQQLNELVVDKQKLQLEINIMKQEKDAKQQFKYSDIMSQSSNSTNSTTQQLKTFEFILYLPQQIKQKFQLKIQDLKVEQNELEQRKQQLKIVSQKLQVERSQFNQMIDDPTLTTVKLRQIRKKLDEKSKFITKQIQKWQDDQTQFQNKQLWLLQLQDVLLSFCSKKNEILEILNENAFDVKRDLNNIKKLISTADSDQMVRFINGMQWWQQSQTDLQISDFDQYEDRQVPKWVDQFKKDLIQ